MSPRQMTLGEESRVREPRTDLGPPVRVGLGEWLLEERRFWERLERVHDYLETPEGQARLQAAAAELRACAECHGGRRSP